MADEYGFELADISLSGQGRRMLLRVFIDKEGGITLHDCEMFSRRLEALLDTEDPLAGSYTLEVSSPGLDRPLKKIEDFRKQVGKLVRIITRERVDNQTFFIGRLSGVHDELLSLSVPPGDREVHIPFSLVTKAQLEIEIR